MAWTQLRLFFSYFDFSASEPAIYAGSSEGECWPLWLIPTLGTGPGGNPSSQQLDGRP